MPVTVSLTISGGTAGERQQLLDAVKGMWPKPDTFVGTDAEWAKEATIQYLEDILNQQLVSAAATAAATTARANRVNLVRG